MGDSLVIARLDHGAEQRLRAREDISVTSNSGASQTAVCVIRVERRPPGASVITVTSTLDVEIMPRGEVRAVRDCRDAIRLINEFLHDSGECEDLPAGSECRHDS
jgi:hypothetical protein